MTLIKSISGIRGTIGGAQGENLTPIDVVKFTTAYARLIKDKNPGKRITIVVGRDARISGPMVDSLVEGTLLGTGVDVINVGMCTTPGTEMAVITHKADGGIIITASHNPRQWNALKLLNEHGVSRKIRTRSSLVYLPDSSSSLTVLLYWFTGILLKLTLPGARTSEGFTNKLLGISRFLLSYLASSVVKCSRL